MHVWADRRVLYILVREGLTDMVTFDHSLQRNERTSPMLCGECSRQRENQVQSPEVRPLLAFSRTSKEDSSSDVNQKARNELRKVARDHVMWGTIGNSKDFGYYSE